MVNDPFISMFSQYLDVVTPFFYSTKKTASYWQITSPVPGHYFNYTVPTCSIKENKTGLDNFQTVYLSEFQQKNGHIEFLVNAGYKFVYWDCWLCSSTLNSYPQDRLPVVPLDLSRFQEYKEVMNAIFSDFPGNSIYLELCSSSFDPNFQSKYPYLKSEFVGIYDDGKLVSAGGLICNIATKIGYLHSGGTLTTHRGRGFQTSLIRERLFKARNNGCDKVYVIVEPGSQSWHNAIHSGFIQIQNAMVLSSKI